MFRILLLASALTMGLLGCRPGEPAVGATAGPSADPGQAIATASQALQSHIQPSKHETLGELEVTSYVVVGLTFDEALGKIAPGLVAAGFERKDKLDKLFPDQRSVTFAHKPSSAMVGLTHDSVTLRYNTFVKR